MKYSGLKLMRFDYRRTEMKMTEGLGIFRSVPDWSRGGNVGVDPGRPIHLHPPKKHNSHLRVRRGQLTD